jgi:hypothetical protein
VNIRVLRNFQIFYCNINSFVTNANRQGFVMRMHKMLTFISALNIIMNITKIEHLSKRLKYQSPLSDHNGDDCVHVHE